MKKYAFGFLAVVLVAVIIFSRSNTAPTPSIEVGKKAPAFSLKDVEGKEHSLDEYLKSKYTVLMFIATQCPISNDYNERMVILHKDYAPKEIAFVGINSNKQESVEEIKEHSAKNGFTFPVLKDWNNVVADAYGAQVTPEIFLLDSKGMVHYHGRIDNARNAEKITANDLRETLDALLAGKAVPKSETKAFGCTIKRVKKES
ncbi:MAG: thioredoxin family protein [Bacteroidota bacterium]